MFYLLFVVSTFFFLFIGLLRTGKIFNPLTFYLLFWGIWIIVSLTNPYQLYSVSDKAYLLIWLNITFFSIGFILFSKGRKLGKVVSKELRGKEVLKTKRFIFLQITILIFLLYYFQKYISLLSTTHIIEARNIVYTIGFLFSNPIEYITFSWIITPLMFMSIVLTITNLIANNQRNIGLFISVINCLIFGQIGYGRFIYFQLIVFILLSLFFKYNLYGKLKSNSNKIKIRTKLFLTTLFLGAIYVMNMSTLKRLGYNSPSFEDQVYVFVNYSFKQFISYFVGPFRAFDNYINQDLPTQLGYTLGRSTFAGIEDVINTLFSYLGLGWTSANNIISSFTVEPITIGENQTFNAFYTNVMNFYQDGGITFVILFATVYGIVSGLLYNYCMQNPNIFTFSLLVYTTYHMIASEYRWSYSLTATWVTIILIFCINQWFTKKYTTSKKTLQ